MSTPQERAQQCVDLRSVQRRGFDRALEQIDHISGLMRESERAVEQDPEMNGVSPVREDKFELNDCVTVRSQMASTVRIGFDMHDRQSRRFWPEEQKNEDRAGNWGSMLDVSRARYLASFRTRCDVETVCDPPGFLHKLDRCGDLVITVDALCGYHSVLLHHAKRLEFGVSRVYSNHRAPGAVYKYCVRD